MYGKTRFRAIYSHTQSLASSSFNLTMDSTGHIAWATKQVQKLHVSQSLLQESCSLLTAT